MATYRSVHLLRLFSSNCAKLNNRLTNSVLAHRFTHSTSTVELKNKVESNESEPLKDEQAYDMIHKLTDGDRATLTKALNQYESNKIKSKIQGMKTSFYF